MALAKMATRFARAVHPVARQLSGRVRAAVATVAVHADAPSAPPAPGGGAHHELDIVAPIGVSTTFSTADGGPVYSRSCAPTRERCEEVLAAVEAAGSPAGSPGARALLFSSGAAATHSALHFLLAEAGAKRLRISGGYHGTHQVAKQLKLIRPGLRVEPLPTEPELERWLDGGAPGAGGSGAPVQSGDILWVETPNNPGCEVADVALYGRAARAVRDAFVVVDSTFAPPPAQCGLLAGGADLLMHSTTKGLSGHSDALGGALLVPERGAGERMAGAYEALRAQRTALGAVPGSLEAWLLLRSLRTLELRVGRQCETAAHLARWLAGRAPADQGGEGAADERDDDLARALTFVHAVHHPSLSGSAGHGAACRQMRLFGSVLALELTSAEAAAALPAALRLFRDATSLGGVESLAEWRHKYDAAVSPRLVRLSVGVEDAADLQADLARAILALHGAEAGADGSLAGADAAAQPETAAGDAPQPEPADEGAAQEGAAPAAEDVLQESAAPAQVKEGEAYPVSVARPPAQSSAEGLARFIESNSRRGAPTPKMFQLPTDKPADGTADSYGGAGGAGGARGGGQSGFGFERR